VLLLSQIEEVRKGENKMKIEEMIKNVFVETGRAQSNWKVVVTDKNLLSAGSDYVIISVDVIRPRCRKPCVKWQLMVDTARGNIHWDKSDFVRC
jgi:hypothetical protein